MKKLKKTGSKAKPRKLNVQVKALPSLPGKEEYKRLSKEMCQCEHSRIAHASILGGFAIGQGKCFAKIGRNPCPCEKYLLAPKKLEVLVDQVSNES